MCDAAPGVRMTGYHGHFFIRSMDLLALPGVSPDNAYAYQLTLDEPIQGNVVCFQAGLLYTTSFGAAAGRGAVSERSIAADCSPHPLFFPAMCAGRPRRAPDPRPHVGAARHQRHQHLVQRGERASHGEPARQAGYGGCRQ